MIYQRLIVSILIILAFFVEAAAQSGKEIYKNYCAGCHGPNLEGSTSGALIKKRGSTAAIVRRLSEP